MMALLGRFFLMARRLVSLKLLVRVAYSYCTGQTTPLRKMGAIDIHVTQGNPETRTCKPTLNTKLIIYVVHRFDFFPEFNEINVYFTASSPPLRRTYT